MIEEILAQLADGEFHSGADLARRCGVSRTAIWQRVRQLEKMGIPLNRVRGRGYRVPRGLDLLDAERIAGGMTPAARTLFGKPHLYLTTGSTNDRALEAAQRDAAAFLCLAEQQESGRGRRGRAWESPFAANLCLSVLQRFSGGAGSVEGLSLAVGLAVARFLVQLGVTDVSLKWPNDVWVGGLKVAGILIEISGDLAGEFCAVIGVGLNVRMRGRDVDIDQPWTDLASHLDNLPDRNTLAAGLVNQFADVLGSFVRGGFAPLREEWQRYDCMHGKDVVLTTGEFTLEGVSLGVDERGGIGIRAAEGVRYFYGGEISLRERPQ